jgi:hypothetical protein
MASAVEIIRGPQDQLTGHPQEGQHSNAGRTMTLV